MILAAELIACDDESDRGPLRQAYGHDHPVYGGTLVFADSDDIRTLDPAIGYDEVSWTNEHLVFDTLLAYDMQQKLIPWLATSWETSPDGLVWTFHLRDDVRFQNGRAMTASDVVYSWERLFDGELASPATDFYGVIDGADAMLDGKAEHLSGLSAPDDHTVVVHIAAPQASFANVVAMEFGAVVPREEVERLGDQWPYHAVGTGPFAVVEWSLGEKTVYARNPYYWRQGLPYLDGVVHLAHYPESLQFLKLEADELHQENRFTSPDYLWVRDNPNWKPYVDEIPQLDTYGELMNTEIPPFDNVWFRRAVSSAIDREKIARLRNWRAAPTASWVPPPLAGSSTGGLPYQQYDVALAKECLAKAGYPNGYPDVIPYTTISQEASIVVGLSIQQDLRAIGVNIAMKNVTFPAYLESAGTRGQVPFAYTAWIMDYPDPENFLEPKFMCDNRADSNSNNDSFWCDPAFDALLVAAKAELDPDKRRAMYEQANTMLAEAAPYAIEYHSVVVNAHQPYVKGISLNPLYTRDFSEAWFDLPDGRDKP
jgi:oligopeptide transport system substrate-binding protein